jgi:tetratricopeptide (TPR) repeat protein
MSEIARPLGAGVAAGAIGVVSVRTMEVLAPRWPAEMALLAAVIVGALVPVLARAGAAFAAFVFVVAADITGHLPRLLSIPGSSRLAAAIAATPALLAVAALVHCMRPDIERSWFARGALLLGLLLPVVFYLLGGPLPLLPPVALVTAVGGLLTLSRSVPVVVLGTAAAIALASLLPLRPGLGDLLAWRLAAQSPAFERDGKREPVVLTEGDLWVGAHLRERHGQGFVAAALPMALRPQARRVLMIDLVPSALEVLVRGPAERIDVAEPEPAVAEAARWLGAPVGDSRVHIASRPPATRDKWDLAFARSPESLRGVPADVRVVVLALGDRDEKQLRADVGAAADLAPHALLLLPDEQTLVVIAADEPLVLAPPEVVGFFARKELATQAAAAGIHNFTDLLALVAGDEQLLRTLARETPGNHHATELPAILGKHAAAAAPSPKLLPPGENAQAWMAAWASRVVEGAVRGEFPGWRGPAALEAAQQSLSSATRARLSALLLRAEGRDDEAAARLDEALRLAPDDVDAARERGRMLLERGQTDAARVPLASVFAHTGTADDRLLLSEALVADGDPTARLHLEELVRAGEMRAHLWLGRLDAREGRLVDAEKELIAYSRAAPEDDEVFYELGSLGWRDRRRAADARGWFETGARNSQRSAAADLRRGQRRLDAGDALGALVFFRRAVAHDRLSAAPRRGLARAYAALGRRQAAQKALDEYLDIVGRASKEGLALIDELGR